jgi:hypothetical protein
MVVVEKIKKMENISKQEKEQLQKVINEKSKDVVYGDMKNADGENVSFVKEELVEEEKTLNIKDVSEKIQFELDKRAMKNKTKEQLIEDLGDLYDLFELKAKECESLKKNYNDALGDIEIYKNEIEEKNQVIIFGEKEKRTLKSEIEFSNRMQNKLEEIIDKLIKSR